MKRKRVRMVKVRRSVMRGCAAEVKASEADEACSDAEGADLAVLYKSFAEWGADC